MTTVTPGVPGPPDECPVPDSGIVGERFREPLLSYSGITQ